MWETAGVGEMLGVHSRDIANDILSVVNNSQTCEAFIVH